MKNIWGASASGTSGVEASFNLNGNPSNYTVQMNHFTNQRGKQSIAINNQNSPNPTFDVFHVHPNNSGPYPSTPNDSADGKGDTTVGDTYGISMFVVSSRGLTVYDPGTKKSSMLRQGFDWMKPCW
jgi:hypothetical protein